MKHEVERIRRQPAEERRTEQDTGDNRTDDPCLAAGAGEAFAEAARDDDHGELQQREEQERFALVYREGCYVRRSHGGSRAFDSSVTLAEASLGTARTKSRRSRATRVALIVEIVF